MEMDEGMDEEEYDEEEEQQMEYNPLRGGGAMWNYLIRKILKVWNYVKLTIQKLMNLAENMNLIWKLR